MYHHHVFVSSLTEKWYRMSSGNLISIFISLKKISSNRKRRKKPIEKFWKIDWRKKRDGKLNPRRSQIIGGSTSILFLAEWRWPLLLNDAFIIHHSLSNVCLCVVQLLHNCQYRNLFFFCFVEIWFFRWKLIKPKIYSGFLVKGAGEGRKKNSNQKFSNSKKIAVLI